MKSAARALALGVTAVLAACGGGDDDKVPATCGAEVETRPDEGALHVPDCSPVSYDSNPPSSGPHYGTWAAFGVYDSPLPRGYWVHNLEHGAVVVTYSCPEGCDKDVARAKEWLANLKDSACPAARVLLTPDPLLEGKWAASAWGVTLRASCFDSEAFTRFWENNHGGAPEQVCSAGNEFRKPDGTLSVAAGCGE